MTTNTNQGIDIETLKEYIFYVSHRQDYNKNEPIGRKVKVGCFDTNKNKYFYRRLLACIIILQHSKEFREYYPDLFDKYIAMVQDKTRYPDTLTSLQNLDNYIAFTSQDIDRLILPSKPVVYILFMLISFYNLNNLLNDFYLIFNRTFVDKKQQLKVQNWDSLIKDDFLLFMLILGLDELELSNSSEEYFTSLQERYIEKESFYRQLIEDRNIKVSTFYNDISVEKFLIDDHDTLKENIIFDYLKEMTTDEREKTERIILSLFVFEISADIQEEISEKSLLYTFVTSKQISLLTAIQKSLTQREINDLQEYQPLQVLEKTYRYIDTDINDLFIERYPDYKLEPFPFD